MPYPVNPRANQEMFRKSLQEAQQRAMAERKRREDMERARKQMHDRQVQQAKELRQRQEKQHQETVKRFDAFGRKQHEEMEKRVKAMTARHDELQKRLAEQRAKLSGDQRRGMQEQARAQARAQAERIQKHQEQFRQFAQKQNVTRRKQLAGLNARHLNEVVKLKQRHDSHAEQSGHDPHRRSLWSWLSGVLEGAAPAQSTKK
jgi:hypothetical protein